MCSRRSFNFSSGDQLAGLARLAGPCSGSAMAGLVYSNHVGALKTPRQLAANASNKTVAGNSDDQRPHKMSCIWLPELRGGLDKWVPGGVVDGVQDHVRD